ncbi:LemA family protein [Tamlana sp. 2201CG12-4]|uniref:LemA family protein n=1 Tax=Tamlana sp. 2201CG12-4 TaxID=3112582 RepID=UPI002DB6A1AA|nr:LemA family protein [Tamlana sp. 2201CG12-4]MEC3905418.1 LemA family protein [Tamlana sp. 2201CG12-4]
MKKGIIAGLGCGALVIIVIIILGAFALIFGYNFNNTAVEYEADAKTAWSKVESSYQRRADLIPNLVSTVKGYAAHEKETLEGVIKARSEATKTTINAGDLTPEKIAQFQQAQQGLSGALSKLLLTVERYPELKADKSFLELQSQLEGTENRINVTRDRYNDAVNIYDIYIKKFPGKLFASILGFEEMARFKSAPGSENAPKVEF